MFFFIVSASTHCWIVVFFQNMDILKRKKCNRIKSDMSFIPQTSVQTGKYMPVFLALLAAFLFGLNAPFSKLLLSHISPHVHGGLSLSRGWNGHACASPVYRRRENRSTAVIRRTAMDSFHDFSGLTFFSPCSCWFINFWFYVQPAEKRMPDAVWIYD